MTTPAETIPVANAIPVTPAVHANNNNVASQEKEDPSSYFCAISGAQYISRFFQVYVGHLDTFLTITVLSSLPAVVGYQWMIMGYFGSSWLFSYFLLPFTRLLANGAAVNATAMIYVLGEQQQIPWRRPIAIGCQRQLILRWILQFLSANTYLNFFLAPLGVFAFTPQLLLLSPSATTTLFGAMTTSAQLVFRRPGTIMATICFTYFLTPFLCWILGKLVNILFPALAAVSQQNVGGDKDGSPADDDEEKEDPYWWALRGGAARQQVQEIVALPLVSCLWTILYLNICIQRKPALKREVLAQEIGIQLIPPSAAVPARVH